MAQCMHLVGDRRCKRSAQWTFPVTYQWLISGTGIEGPNLRMCRQHGNGTLDVKKEKRFPVIDGWYGHIWNDEAKVWTVLRCVFSTETGHLASKAWAKYKRPCDGKMWNVDYDDARRAA